MASNRGVVYVGPGKVEVQSIDFPKLVDPRGRRRDQGVILKVVSTNICGSDQHMVRGRTTAPPGLVREGSLSTSVVMRGAAVARRGVIQAFRSAHSLALIAQCRVPALPHFARHFS